MQRKTVLAPLPPVTLSAEDFGGKTIDEVFNNASGNHGVLQDKLFEMLMYTMASPEFNGHSTLYKEGMLLAYRRMSVLISASEMKRKQDRKK